MIGPNGIGKSNLLEAVELLGSLRSLLLLEQLNLLKYNTVTIQLEVGLMQDTKVVKTLL